jgi:hypothetical protein
MNPGQTFGRLTALTPAAKKYYWNFRCVCGKEIVTRKTQVIHGQTRSCGCLRKEAWRKK